MQAVILQLNHISYAECGGVTMTIPALPAEGCCGNIQPLGDYWGVPETSDGIFRGYNIVKAASAPTADSIPLFRLKDGATGNLYHILGTEAQWRQGGAVADSGVMPLAATIPAVAINYAAHCESEPDYVDPDA